MISLILLRALPGEDCRAPESLLFRVTPKNLVDDFSSIMSFPLHRPSEQNRVSFHGTYS